MRGGRHNNQDVQDTYQCINLKFTILRSDNVIRPAISYGLVLVERGDRIEIREILRESSFSLLEHDWTKSLDTPHLTRSGPPGMSDLRLTGVSLLVLKRGHLHENDT